MNNNNYSGELPESIHLLPGTTRDDIADLLMNLPLFDNLDSKELGILSRHFKLYMAQPGAVLFNEGDAGDFMAIVVDGAAELTKSRAGGATSAHVATAGYGKVVGEMALIDGKPRSASAAFISPTRILVLTRQSFDSIISEYKRTGIGLLWNLCRNLSHRVRHATGMLIEHNRR